MSEELEPQAVDQTVSHQTDTQLNATKASHTSDVALYQDGTQCKAFSYASNAEGWVPVKPSGTPASLALGYDAGGHDLMLAHTMTPAQLPWNVYWEYVTTWEALGVPPGGLVSAINLQSSSNLVQRTKNAGQIDPTAYFVPNIDLKVGPYELYTDDGTLIGTIWPGRTTRSSDPGIQTVPAQIALAVPPDKRTSGTTVRIRMRYSAAVAADPGSNPTGKPIGYEDMFTYEKATTFCVAFTAGAPSTVSHTSDVLLQQQSVTHSTDVIKGFVKAAKTANISFNTYQIAAKVRHIRWSSAEIPEVRSEIRFNTRALATKQQQIQFDVRKRVSLISSISYDVRKTTNKELAVGYAVRKLISRNARLTWRSQSKVTKNYQIYFDTRKSLKKSWRIGWIDQVLTQYTPRPNELLDLYDQSVNDLVIRRGRPSQGFNPVSMLELYGASMIEMCPYEPDPVSSRHDYYYNTKHNRAYRRVVTARGRTGGIVNAHWKAMH